MSILTNAQGVEINGGQFTATTTVDNSNNYLSGPTGIDILREASAPEAAHDSSARTYSPRCFPGTREQYIEDIVRRAIPSLGDNPLPIYWMRGPAGVGKSAIAQTCAEKLQKKGALGATFFFSVSGQRKPEKFFPSIAYQLSTVHLAYRDLVDRKVRRDKTLVNKAMQFQFQYLIGEPLRELEENGKGIRKRVQVFVDGLDECEGTDAQCEIIRIVTAAASEGVIPLRWAFFSRPEPHIEAAFSRTHVAPHCYKTVLPISSDADGEIELYLRNCFDNILQLRNAPTQTPWPSAEDMEIVVRGAGGSFIYATTVVRFVGRPDSLSPQKRLHTIIDVILYRHSGAGTSNDAPFAELDAFYMLILQRIPTDIFPSAHLLLAVMCQWLGSSAILTANILGLSKDELEAVFNHVNAVIHLEDPGKDIEIDPTIDTNRAYAPTGRDDLQELFPQAYNFLGGQVGFYHKSFPDFLLDPARSGSYCVRPSEALANHLVKIHLDYDRRFSWRGSELVLAPGVPDSAAFLSYPYTNELVNSLVKLWIYRLAGDEDLHSFPAPREADADRDFRKRLHFLAHASDGNAYARPIWGCKCRRKRLGGVYIDYILCNEFYKFPVTEFKSMIKLRKQANIIRRYHPELTSRIKSLFRDKSREGIESALYRMGHGKKSIFWYWEINHKLQYYRSFRAIDLAEGEKRFREEDFDSWPEYGQLLNDNDNDDDEKDKNKEKKTDTKEGKKEDGP